MMWDLHEKYGCMILGSNKFTVKKLYFINWYIVNIPSKVIKSILYLYNIPITTVIINKYYIINTNI